MEGGGWRVVSPYSGLEVHEDTGSEEDEDNIEGQDHYRVNPAHINLLTLEKHLGRGSLGLVLGDNDHSSFTVVSSRWVAHAVLMRLVN